MENDKRELVDIFACGIIIFILRCKNPPWKAALEEDPWFNTFVTSYKKFWYSHQKFLDPDHFDSDFIDLFNNMCSYDFEERSDIEQCL